MSHEERVVMQMQKSELSRGEFSSQLEYTRDRKPNMKLRFGVAIALVLFSVLWWGGQPKMGQAPSTIEVFAEKDAVPLNEPNSQQAVPVVNQSSIPISFEWVTSKKGSPIVPVGIDSSNQMELEEGIERISWYESSAIPGNSGNAILAGHRDWAGALGSFQYLETVSQGEQVVITYEDKTTRTFEVVSKQVYSFDNIPSYVTDISGEPRVTLITCTGAFDRAEGGYQNRVVVVLKEFGGK